MKRVVNKIFPWGSRRRHYLKMILMPLGLITENFQTDFKHYVIYHEPYLFLPKRDYPNQPLISIIVPLYNTQQRYLEQLVHSVINQTYENWELILADGSSEESFKASSQRIAGWDSRIKYFDLKENHGIATNTNRGIDKAKGEFLAFVDHDDVLSVHALNEIVAVINDNPKLDLIYSDEDKLSDNGLVRLNPHFKPDWSPDLLRNVNYITHLLVIRRQVVEDVGGVRKGFEGAQDYDLILRVVDKTQNIHHIPKILYHWREAKSSTAVNFKSTFGTKKNILDAGAKAVNEHLLRNHSFGLADPIAGSPGFYRVSYNQEKLKPWALVFWCPTEGEIALAHLQNFISATKLHPKSQIITQKGVKLNTPYRNVELGASLTNSPQEFFDQLLKAVDTDYIMFVGNHLLYPSNTQWPNVYGGILEENHIATVAPRIIDEGGVIRYLGYANESLKSGIFKNIKSNESTYFGSTDWVRNVYRQGSTFAIKTQNFRKFYKPDAYDPESNLLKSDFFAQALDGGFYHMVYSHLDFRTYNGISTISYKKRDYFSPSLGALDKDILMKTCIGPDDE